jgi:hypothetical protein
MKSRAMSSLQVSAAHIFPMMSGDALTIRHKV